MEYKTKDVRAGFDRAASRYDEQAELQKTVSDAAAEIAEKTFPKNASVLDIGCGTGNFGRYAKSHALKWSVTGFDLSFAMCRKANGVQGNWEALPFADAAFDGVFSSLTLQWVNDIPAALAETARVLKPGGTAVVATLCEGTLHELHESFLEVDNVARVHEFHAKETLCSRLEDAGFDIADVREEQMLRRYPDVAALMDSIRAIGAANRRQNRPRAFSRRAVFQRMERAYRQQFGSTDGIPSTWNVVYFTLRKPA